MFYQIVDNLNPKTSVDNFKKYLFLLIAYTYKVILIHFLSLLSDFNMAPSKKSTVWNFI